MNLIGKEIVITSVNQQRDKYPTQIEIEPKIDLDPLSAANAAENLTRELQLRGVSLDRSKMTAIGLAKDARTTGEIRSVNTHIGFVINQNGDIFPAVFLERDPN